MLTLLKRVTLPRVVTVGFPRFSVNRWCSSAAVQGTRAREAYLFVYTCKVCGNRSERKISKQAYHHGVVLVQCPGCEKHHLVADNLKWFEDSPVNIQSLMQRQGESVFTGTVDTVLEELIQIDGITKEAIQERMALGVDPPSTQ